MRWCGWMALALVTVSPLPAGAAAVVSASAAVTSPSPSVAESIRTLGVEQEALKRDTLELMNDTLRKGAPAVKLALENRLPAMKAMRARREAFSAKIEGELQRIVETSGWPKKSVIGEELSEMALTLVMEVTHVEFQRWCLDRIERAADDGEVPLGRKLAMVTDRVLIAEGKGQRYGTSLDFDMLTNSCHPKPIDAEDAVDERRATLGLLPLKVELAAWNKEVKKGARRAASARKMILKAASEAKPSPKPSAP